MEPMDSLAQQKGDMLLKQFNEMGWDLEYELSQEEILTFLNKSSTSGFDQNLSSKLFEVLGLEDSQKITKLFEVLGLEDSQKITVEDFISYYIQFEDDLLQNSSELKNKIINEQNNYNKYQEEAYKKKKKKLNSEGFCEDAKKKINRCKQSLFVLGI